MPKSSALEDLKEFLLFMGESAFILTALQKLSEELSGKFNSVFSTLSINVKRNYKSDGIMLNELELFAQKQQEINNDIQALKSPITYNLALYMETLEYRFDFCLTKIKQYADFLGEKETYHKEKEEFYQWEKNIRSDIKTIKSRFTKAISGKKTKPHFLLSIEDDLKELSLSYISTNDVLNKLAKISIKDGIGVKDGQITLRCKMPENAAIIKVTLEYTSGTKEVLFNPPVPYQSLKELLEEGNADKKRAKSPLFKLLLRV